MAVATTFRLLCALIFVSYVPCAVSEAKSQRLLMILLDGFRFDYLNQTSLPLPGFDKLAKMGVKAEALEPDFPSLSYPNYYSLTTGLHTELHGMTGDYMYDVTSGDRFLKGTNPAQFNAHWWDGGDPVWITAVRQNKSSHMFYWPGCEVEIRGLRPTFCQNYTGVPSMEDFRSALNQSVTLLQSGQTDLAGIYFEKTDKLGHQFGPFSTELKSIICDLDLIISDLVDRLSEPEMSDVNLMVFSDHGMTEVSPDHVIDISEALIRSEDNDTTILGGFAVVSIYTVPCKQNLLFSKLDNFHPNMTVYRQSDLPERWHYKHGPYVAPLTAVADPGWVIFTPVMKERNVTLKKGMHGYDNLHSDMQGIFLAMGPAFKAGQTVERLRTVDLYQAMCDILHIEPSPNSGSRSHLTTLLTSHDGIIFDLDFLASSTAFTYVVGIVVMFLLIVMYRSIRWTLRQTDD